ncbi:MAG: hypothetical protein U0136_15400 [Bdellovibrionota bacterium]
MSADLSTKSISRERGVAFLELTIVLVIFTPLIVGFVFVWLPDFSRRSNELMNALASLGTCVVEPANIYRFRGGQLVVRDDVEAVVQQLLANCSVMSGGETVCGFVYDNDGTEAYRFGLNETPARACSSIDVMSCTGRSSVASGLVIGFVLNDGTARCEFVQSSDAGAVAPRGDGVDDKVSFPKLCGGGTYEAACRTVGLNSIQTVCCPNDTVYNPTFDVCSGCPLATHHSCFMSSPSCVSNSNPRFGSSGCCQTTDTSGVYCASGEQLCHPAVGAAMCCPAVQSCAAYLGSAGLGALCQPALSILDCGCVPPGTSGLPAASFCSFGSIQSGTGECIPDVDLAPTPPDRC